MFPEGHLVWLLVDEQDDLEDLEAFPLYRMIAVELPIVRSGSQGAVFKFLSIFYF